MGNGESSTRFSRDKSGRGFIQWGDRVKIRIAEKLPCNGGIIALSVSGGSLGESVFSSTMPQRLFKEENNLNKFVPEGLRRICT